jgi:hypothetical protein
MVADAGGDAADDTTLTVADGGVTTLASGGDLTFDSADDVILDVGDGGAANGDIHFKYNGTTRGSLRLETAETLRFMSSGDVEVLRIDAGTALTGMRFAGQNKLEFASSNKYIHSDGTDLAISSSTDVNIYASADFLVDVTNDIILDAHGNNVTLKSSGTPYLDFINSSGNCIVSSSSPAGTVNDIIFHGKDQTEVYRLDASANSVLLATDKKIEFRDANSYIQSNAANDLKIVATDVTIDAATLIDLQSDAVHFGENGDTDVVLTFNANSADGVLTWMEDEDQFKFSDDVLLDSTEQLQFRDANSYIYSPTANDLEIVATDITLDAAVLIDLQSDAINLGEDGDTDVVLTFKGDTSDGVLTWMEDEDHFKFSDDVVMNAAQKLYFHDEGDEHIHASGDGQLDINAGTTLAIDAPIVNYAGGGTGQPQINIVDVTNDTAAAVINLTKNRFDSGFQPNQDGDSLGRLAFKGKNSAGVDWPFASITGSAPDVTDDTEDGRLSFVVCTAGDQTKEVMTLINGRVGINDTSPDALLNIVGTSTTAVPSLRVDHARAGQIGVDLNLMNTTAVGVSLDTMNTTAAAMAISSSALTEGSALDLYSNASSAAKRSMLRIRNGHDSAVSASACEIIGGTGFGLIVRGSQLAAPRNFVINHNTAGQPISASVVLDSVYYASGRNSSQSDTIESAANIINNIPDASVGMYGILRYYNVSSNSVTLAGGKGVVMTNTATASFAVGAGKGRVFSIGVSNIAAGHEHITVLPLSDAFNMNS